MNSAMKHMTVEYYMPRCDKIDIFGDLLWWWLSFIMIKCEVKSKRLLLIEKNALKFLCDTLGEIYE